MNDAVRQNVDMPEQQQRRPQTNDPVVAGANRIFRLITTKLISNRLFRANEIMGELTNEIFNHPSMTQRQMVHLAMTTLNFTKNMLTANNKQTLDNLYHDYTKSLLSPDPLRHLFLMAIGAVITFGITTSINACFGVLNNKESAPFGIITMLLAPYVGAGVAHLLHNQYQYTQSTLMSKFDNYANTLYNTRLQQINSFT